MYFGRIEKGCTGCWKKPNKLLINLRFFWTLNEQMAAQNPKNHFLFRQIFIWICLLPNSFSSWYLFWFIKFLIFFLFWYLFRYLFYIHIFSLLFLFFAQFQHHQYLLAKLIKYLSKFGQFKNFWSSNKQYTLNRVDPFWEPFLKSVTMFATGDKFIPPP